MNNIIGIIGAMDIEVSALVEKMDDPVKETFGGITFTKGTLCGKNVVISKCGIGKVFAAMCAQTMILKYSPSCIINSGVAGALSSELSILDAVIATRLVQHDMDTSPLGDPKGLISGINVVEIQTDDAVSTQLEKAANELGTHTVRGIIASGDQFIADPTKKAEISSVFNAVACEMEGASIAQVCYVNEVSFCVMRTISDGKGEAMDYQTFAVSAAKKSMEIIEKFLSDK